MKFKRIQIIEYVKVIVTAVLAAIIFRSCAFEAYKIPSSSMTPTLMIGDLLFVSKYSYGYSKYSFPIRFGLIKNRLFATTPARGDIIVFQLPSDTSISYIKRLIGFPGDKIQVKRGELYVNDAPVPRKKVGIYKALYSDEPQGSYDCYEETLENGVRYYVLQSQLDSFSQLPNNTGIYTVPEGHYFMMGDHRNNSTDSRYILDVGFIPEENIIGRAELLFWTRDFSFWEFCTNFKLNRLFNRLSHEPTLSISQPRAT